LITKGSVIRKYNQMIGIDLVDIELGSHVHTKLRNGEIKS